MASDSTLGHAGYYRLVTPDHSQDLALDDSPLQLQMVAGGLLQPPPLTLIIR